MNTRVLTAADRQKATDLGSNLLSAFYESREQDLSADASQLELLLQNLLIREGLGGLDVRGSVKGKASALEKIARKCADPRSDYASRFLEGEGPERVLTDLVRARIICRFADQIDVVQDVVSKRLAIDVDNTVDFREPHEWNTFGYAAMHVVCRPLSDGLFFSDCSFEVQIRSWLMDLWGVVNWDIDYKPVEEAPYEVKRRLSSVAALFYLIDREFTAIRREMESRHHSEVASPSGLPISDPYLLEGLEKRQVRFTGDEVKSLLQLKRRVTAAIDGGRLPSSGATGDSLSLYLLDRDRFRWVLDSQTAYDVDGLDI